MSKKDRLNSTFEIGTNEELPFERKASAVNFSIVFVAFFLFGIACLYIPFKVAINEIRRNDDSPTLFNANTKPNIVFILTDDQGMGDMDITGNDIEGLMPYIRSLSAAGLNFTSHYTATRCTPTRSSFLTGRYSIHNGMYHSVVGGTNPWGLPLSEKLLPEYLVQAGYGNMYHLGKWHLGHHTTSHLPNSRGFTHSLGFYGGYQHPKKYHYEWNKEYSTINTLIPDMHLNGVKYEAIPDEIADYHNSYLMADEAERIIAQEGLTVQKLEKYEEIKPFFMFFSPPLIHMPLIPDDTIMDMRLSDLTHITDNWRKKTAVMLIMLDNIVGRIMKALDTAKVLDNTIIIFSSDNGAQCSGNHNGAGSNFPLRGCKGSLYEGGTRVPAFVFSHLLGHKVGKPGTQLTTMFHITDWLPTLISGMLGHSDLLPTGIDGINQWSWLMHVVETASGGEIVLNEQIPLIDTNTAINSLKDTIMTAPRTSVIYNIDVITGISAIRMDNFKLIINESMEVGWHDSSRFGSEVCIPVETFSNSIQLYDIEKDEQERVNLAEILPDVVALMRAEIQKHISIASKPAACEYNDYEAIILWRENNSIEPWIKLDGVNSDEKSKRKNRQRKLLRDYSERSLTNSSTTSTIIVDYVCPIDTYTQSTCVTV